MSDPILDRLLNACNEQKGEQPSEALQQAFGEFVPRAREDQTLLEPAVAWLQTLPPAGAGWLALAIGAVIEGGRGAGLTAPAVVDLFLSWLLKFPVSAPGQEGTAISLTSEQQELAEAFPQLCRSVVAHLARVPARRAALAQDAKLIERLHYLEDHAPGAVWVREMLSRRSGTLVVLHPVSGTGFHLRYVNVGSCFHLFSLIQGVLGTGMVGGKTPDPAVVAAAKGQSNEPVNDVAWWHYGDPRHKSADLTASIWGEGMLDDIPTINGVQVILLWPTLMASRGWNSGFFGAQLEALPPDLIVEKKLTDRECDEWFATLGLDLKPRRKWWPW